MDTDGHVANYVETELVCNMQCVCSVSMYCWILLDTVAYCWILLDTVGYCWILLDTVVFLCTKWFVSCLADS